MESRRWIVTSQLKSCLTCQMAVMAVSDQLESVEEEDILRLDLTSEVIQWLPRPFVLQLEDNDPQELVGPAARLEGAHRDVAERHQKGWRVPGRRGRRRRLRRLRGRQESHRSVRWSNKMELCLLKSIYQSPSAARGLRYRKWPFGMASEVFWRSGDARKVFWRSGEGAGVGGVWGVPPHSRKRHLSVVCLSVRYWAN